MPRTTRTQEGKRFKKKRKSRAVTRRRKPLPLGGFPNRLLAKLKYVSHVTLDAGAATLATNVYRANSLFDPDSTAVGHQPSNFDKLSTIYDRYTVLGARLKVYWMPNGSTISTPACLVAHLSEAGTSIATAHASGGISNVLEQPRMSRSVAWVGTSNGPVTVLTKNFSAKKFFGVSNLIGESPYSADTTANPTEGAFFEVSAISPDDSVNPSPLPVRVEIEYIAMFTEPKLTDAS